MRNLALLLALMKIIIIFVLGKVNILVLVISLITKKKYFPLENLELVNDATNIMNRMKKEISNDKKAYESLFRRFKTDLYTFAKQNRDICKKNFIIELINGERK